ncbi:MAG TPA: hypothetical protein VND64_29915 [Pirellulales bacterium]|nr:hypothetical protein [Pirellulales bacterium]
MSFRISRFLKPGAACRQDPSALVAATLAALVIVLAETQTVLGTEPKRPVRNATSAAPDVASPDPMTKVKLVRVPHRGIQPQAAVDGEGTVHLIYLGDEPGAANVYYVSKAAGSEMFSEPLRVNSQGGSAMALGSIRGAQLAIGKGNRVHVAWNGSGAGAKKVALKNGSPMLYARLAGDGVAFEPERNVAREAVLLDGGGSVAADSDGNVYVVWHSGDGEENRRVWVARSTDDGATFAPEQPADSKPEGACGCCGLKAFADREGILYVLYRSARENVNRDMLLLTSIDCGQTFRTDRAGPWKVDVCPMSSESFLDGPQAVTAAWETDGQVLLSRFDKKKRRFSKPLAPPGAPAGRKHPALAGNPRGETILVWAEGTGWQRGGALAWQVFDAAGKPTKIAGRSDGVPVWSFPAVYADPDGSFAIIY